MAKIPLNKFRNRLILNVPTNLSDPSAKAYEVPEFRATILINAQATNNTESEILVSFYIQNENNIKVPLVKNFPIPGNDSRSLIAGRVVLEGIDGAGETDLTTEKPDSLWVEANSTGLSLSLSLLETVNKT